jgi:hypothetical protein
MWTSLKGWGVVKGVLSCFDLDVDSAEPTPGVKVERPQRSEDERP